MQSARARLPYRVRSPGLVLACHLCGSRSNAGCFHASDWKRPAVTHEFRCLCAWYGSQSKPGLRNISDSRWRMLPVQARDTHVPFALVVATVPGIRNRSRSFSGSAEIGKDFAAISTGSMCGPDKYPDSSIYTVYIGSIFGDPCMLAFCGLRLHLSTGLPAQTIPDHKTMMLDVNRLCI